MGLTRQVLLYGIGLAIMLAALMLTQFYLKSYYERQVDPTLIDLAGRQRTLCQRLAKLSLYSISGIDTIATWMKPADSIAKYTKVAEQVHEQLIAYNATVVKDNLIDSTLQAITPSLQILIDQATQSATSHGGDNAVVNREILRTLPPAEFTVLKGMDQVTHRLSLLARQNNESIRIVELLFAVALGLLIIGLGLTIYLPILRKMEASNEKLTKANEELSRSKQEIEQDQILLRTIIDNIAANIYVKDPQSRKTLANRWEYEYLGAKSESEILGKSDYEIFPEASAKVSVREDQEVMKSKKSIIARETFNFKRDGTERWFQISKVPLFNAQQEVIGLVGISIDITDRRKATLELQASLQEIRELYDNAPCGYHTIDADGLIIRMNRTELKWLGYTHDEVVGRMNIRELVTAKSLEERKANLVKLQAAGSLDNIEAEFVRKDGSVMQVSLNTQIVTDDQGKFIQNRSTAFNITVRKKLEEDLKAANKELQWLNEEKNELLSMATHDLKNPIHSINGLLHLMELQTQLPADTLELLAMIRKTTRRMNELIEQLLDYSRVDQGFDSVIESDVDLAAVVSDRVMAFVNQAKEKQIALNLKLDEPKLVVTSDAGVLGQVIDNLISNAIKYSPLGSSVDIRLAKDAARSVIDVIDRGPGLSEEDMAKMFRPFSKLSAKPTRGESSTGLGLAIAKRQITLLGGEIRVQSELGKGSRFQIIL